MITRNAVPAPTEFRVRCSRVIQQYVDFTFTLIDNDWMIQVSIDEIKRDLPAVLQRVEAGETIIITHAGKPMAEIKPIASDPEKRRPFGLCAGEFEVPDDFDEPLPEAILQEFEG